MRKELDELQGILGGLGSGATNSTDVVTSLNKAFLEGGLWRTANEILREQKKQTIAKALATGPGVGFGAGTGIQDLRLEDLSSVLTRQVFGSDTVPFYRRLRKSKAENILVQYNRLTQLGTWQRGFPFVQEGALPKGDDSAWVRQTDLVKYIGNLRAVTDVATRVKTGGGVANLRADENRNGMDFLLQELEMALYFAKQSTSTVNGQALAFDGIEEQIRAAGLETNWVDKHGFGLTPEDFQNAAYIQKTVGRHGFAKSNAGVLSNLSMFCDPLQAKMVNEHLGPFARFQMQSSAGNRVTPGIIVPGVQTQWGYYPMVDDVWLGEGRRVNETVPIADEGVLPPDPPSAVTIAIVAPGVVVAAGQESFWLATDTAAASFYAVTAVGPNGETAQVVTAPTNVTPATLGAVDITITHPVSNAGFSYNIWRGPNANNLRLVYQIPPTVGATTVWRDLNFWMPGTTPSFAIVFEDSAIDMAELTPFFSLNLGVIDLTYRWVIMCYLTLRLKNPLKMIWFRNCGSEVA